MFINLSLITVTTALVLLSSLFTNNSSCLCNVFSALVWDYRHIGIYTLLVPNPIPQRIKRSKGSNSGLFRIKLDNQRGVLILSLDGAVFIAWRLTEVLNEFLVFLNAYTLVLLTNSDDTVSIERNNIKSYKSFTQK